MNLCFSMEKGYSTENDCSVLWRKAALGRVPRGLTWIRLESPHPLQLKSKMSHHRGTLHFPWVTLCDSIGFKLTHPRPFKKPVMGGKNKLLPGSMCFGSLFKHSALFLPISKQGKRNCEERRKDSDEGSSKKEEEGHKQQLQGLPGQPKPWQPYSKVVPWRLSFNEGSSSHQPCGEKQNYEMPPSFLAHLLPGLKSRKPLGFSSLSHWKH